ncbi:MAG: metallophosphoesterase family protein [Candidatus Geothermarchaeales archaeon]
MSKHQTVIGVISDTHIPTRSRMIPEKVFDVFKDVDLIVHAGDLVNATVLKELKKLGPVVGVYGNMDPPEVRRELPEVKELELHGKKLGIMHDPGVFSGRGRMERLAKERGFDVLIFGHTHRAQSEEKEGILYFNPGSATNPLPPFVTKPSVGKLMVSPDGVEASIIKI